MFTKKEMMEMYAAINLDFGDRWEKDADHHPKSIEVAKHLEALDYYFCDDALGWKFGGDGDNGEDLLYALDCYFERLDLPPIVTKELDGITFSNGYMGDPKAWCYWSTDDPEDGSCGPFESDIRAVAHAAKSGCWDEEEDATDLPSFKATVAEFASKLGRVPKEIRDLSGVPYCVKKKEK